MDRQHLRPASVSDSLQPLCWKHVGGQSHTSASCILTVFFSCGGRNESLCLFYSFLFSVGFFKLLLSGDFKIFRDFQTLFVWFFVFIAALKCCTLQNGSQDTSCISNKPFVWQCLSVFRWIFPSKSWLKCHKSSFQGEAVLERRGQALRWQQRTGGGRGQRLVT